MSECKTPERKHPISERIARKRADDELMYARINRKRQRRDATQETISRGIESRQIVPRVLFPDPDPQDDLISALNADDFSSRLPTVLSIFTESMRLKDADNKFAVNIVKNATRETQEEILESISRETPDNKYRFGLCKLLLDKKFKK